MHRKSASVSRTAGTARMPFDVGDFLHHPENEAKLGQEADMRLHIAENMRRRVGECRARHVDPVVGENPLPRHQNVVAMDHRVGFVIPIGEGIIELAGCELCEGTAR